jgi:predicted RNase H-like nuclease (RuvC/YqgF family)
MLLDENVAIEQCHTKMRAETADYRREISAMIIKIQEMEAHIQAYDIRNAELRGCFTMLETESSTLRRKISDLGLKQKQGRIPDSTVQNM